MKTPLLFAGSTSAPSTTLVNYAPLVGGAGVVIYGPAVSSAAPLGMRNAACAPGTVSTLRVRFPTALSAGQTYAVTLVKNGTDTSLTCTVSDAGLTASDLVTEVTVAEGDTLCWKITPSGTPNAQTAPIQISAVFEGDNAGEGVLFSFIRQGTAAGFVIPGLAASFGSSETNSTGVMPCAGSISKLRVSLTTAPGSGNSRTFTLKKNGVDTALTLTLSDTTAAGSTSATAVTFAAGDTITLSMTVSTPVTSNVAIGLDWTPTVDGEFPLFAVPLGALSNAATRYLSPNGQTSNAEATEANTYVLAPADMTWSGLRADISTAPGDAKSRTFTVRSGGVDTALSVAISGASDTTGTDADTLDVTAGDLLSIAAVPAGTPNVVTYNRVGIVAVVDSAAPSLAFTIAEKSAGFAFEGMSGTGTVAIDVSWTATPGNGVQARIVDANGDPLSGFDWTTKIASPAADSSGTLTFSGVPAGGWYRLQVRDGDNTVQQNGSNDFGVGAVVLMWGQSQMAYLQGIDLGGLAADAGVMASWLTKTDKANEAGAIPLHRITGTPAAVGAGLVAAANQWHADTGLPVMFVDISYVGTSIDNWNDAGTGTGASWTLHAFRDAMIAAAEGQASAVLMFQGTSNVAAYQDYAAEMDTFKTQWEAALPGQTPLFIVMPHPRSNDGELTWSLRNVQHTKATSGGTWRLGGWLLDWQMDGDGSPHEATGATGVDRGGTRVGRALAKNLDDADLDVTGPAISSARFTDDTNAVIELTYNKAISLADGTAYAGSDVALADGLFSVSDDSGSTWNAPNAPGFSAAITASNKVQLTKDSGAWTGGGSTRIDYLRGIPFSSDSNDTNEYVGAEADMETARLSLVITDTSSFDGNRGMPAAPVMGTGMVVASPASPGTAADRKGVARSQVRQLVTALKALDHRRPDVARNTLKPKRLKVKRTRKRFRPGF